MLLQRSCWDFRFRTGISYERKAFIGVGVSGIAYIVAVSS